MSLAYSQVGSDDVVELLDARVRELVRREGVDPQRDSGVVRRIAEGVVRDHDERSLTGVVAPVADVGALVAELVARVAGFGPLQPFLDDMGVEEIWINDPCWVGERWRTADRPTTTVGGTGVRLRCCCWDA